MSFFADYDNEHNGNYLKLLSSVSKLSGLFSESSVPYINYRVAENIFCNCFDAENLSRSDTAFDANFKSRGIGLKTFVCLTESSNEKVAEFNSLAPILRGYSGYDLAYKLSEFRNERIKLASRLYQVDESEYHVVARRKNELKLFEADYSTIKLDALTDIKETKSSLHFNDGINYYTFNHSKSTLFRKFIIPRDAFSLPVEIIADPFKLLLEMFEEKGAISAKNKLTRGVDYVILPLYGSKNGEKFVFERSGLNQWNAGGRLRDFGEIYIPIPITIHRMFPDFFPSRNERFELEIPSGETMSAKVCQENSKALMTDPNNALSDWLLRNILQLEEGELATIEKLLELGFDSVILTKIDQRKYKIDIVKFDGYESFIRGEDDDFY